MKKDKNLKKNTKKKDTALVKKIKQHMYKWHRTLGIITLIPVLFWTLSGLMHPFMAHFFKPEITHDKLEQQTITKKQLPLSVKEVLVRNKIAAFKNFRIVAFNSNTYYQVKTVGGALAYFNATSAEKLFNGDQKYAEWLARYFLGDNTSTLTKSEVLTEFNSQYKYVNRYLPVYKLSFDRPDGMEIYVETVSSKLATFNPTSRQIFIWFFDTFHNWSFIDAITNNSLRIMVMILFLSIITFSALSGILIYGLLWEHFRKSNSLQPQQSLLNYHRQIGIWVSLFTLTFAFSGAYHATTKWEPYTLHQMIYEPTIKTAALAVANNSLSVDWKNFENSSIIALNNTLYYRCQLFVSDAKKSFKTIAEPTPKWKEKKSKEVKIKYINVATNQEAPTIDIQYARFLAYYFTDGAPKAACCEMIPDLNEKEQRLEKCKLIETKVITSFESSEYGFVNKRLPVVKLAYDNPNNTTFYIETATSRLAAKIENSDKREGYSFAILHKFLFLDWAGKNIRDSGMVLAALSLLIVSFLGFRLFLKRK